MTIIYKNLTKEQIVSLPEEEKVALLEIFNDSYRNGKEIISDIIYDEIVESLPFDHPFRSEIGFDIPESEARKEALPVEMHSREKCKTTEELLKWCELRKFPKDTKFAITPKYDGISLLVKLDKKRKVWTRGRRGDGRRSDKHFETLEKSSKFIIPEILDEKYVNGEAILQKSKFPKYAKSETNPDGKENPRSLVSSLFARDEVDPILKDINFICYGINEDFADKDKMMEVLNSFNTIKVPVKVVELKNITDDMLQSLYKEWSQEFELDGLVIDVNDMGLREELGSETNGNPRFSKAWKGAKDESASTTIREIVYQISKEGNMCPVGIVDPVRLENSTVKRVTLYNAGYIKSSGCGENSEIEIIKSGKIIPKVLKVTKSVLAKFPEKCPSCSTKLVWDNNEVHLLCPNHENCSEQRIQKLLAFVKIMEMDGIAEGTIRRLYDSGINTVEILLSVSPDELLKIEGIGSSKSNSIVEEIHNHLTKVSLEKLQHASGMFVGLGSKMLARLNHFNSPDNIPSVEDIIKIDGFSTISANIYCNNIQKFWNCVKTLPITIKEKKLANGSKCKGWIVVFTQFRDKELEEKVESEGGKISTSVSGKTTHVICVNPDDATGKVQKARENGCKIWKKETLMEFFS